jgi:hypothetical protein
MSATALFLLTALAGAQPSLDADRTPIRCRPAPLYVADAAARPKPERIASSRMTTQPERRAHPCLLMQAPARWVVPGSMRMAG